MKIELYDKEFQKLEHELEIKEMPSYIVLIDPEGYTLYQAQVYGDALTKYCRVSRFPSINYQTIYVLNINKGGELIGEEWYGNPSQTIT